MSVTNYIIDWFERLGQLTPWSGLVLGLFFTAAALVAFPRTPLIVAAGASFGLSVVPIILLGSTTGGAVAFLLARHLAAKRFHRWLGRRPKLRAIAFAVDLEGWRIIALLRLGAPIPSSAQNYMLGLTKIGLSTYAGATLVFSIPQIFLLSFLGATGRASLLNSSTLTSSIVSIALALILIALISWRVRLMLRKSLEAQTSSRSQ